MKRKIPTITIATCAYNEEKNIASFLRSGLNQKQDEFVLEKILVISDGSTDHTVRIARQMKSKILIVKDYKERVGKSSRLDEIYRTLRTDILVQSDADVVLAHPYVIRDLIKPISDNPKVSMCGGHPTPVKATTFIEKAINCTFQVYDELRSTFRNGNNSLSADGRLLAFRKELVSNLYIPANMIANDLFAYYSCLTLGYTYRYVSSAIIYFRSPQTLKDQIRQNTRFEAAPIRMTRYFPRELVYRESHVPIGMLIPGMLRQFIRHPLLCSYIFAINTYCRILAGFKETKLNAKWQIATTTKYRVV